MKRVLIEYNKNSSFADVQYGIELWKGWADQAIVAFHPSVMEQAKKLINQYGDFILPGLKTQGFIEDGRLPDERSFWRAIGYAVYHNWPTANEYYLDLEWPFRDYSDKTSGDPEQYNMNLKTLAVGLDKLPEGMIFFPSIQTPPTQRENQIPLVDTIYKMTGGKFLSDAHATGKLHESIETNTSHKAMLNIMPQDKIIYLMWVHGEDTNVWRNHQLKVISTFKFDMVIHPSWTIVDGFPNFITLGRIADSL